MDLAGPAGGETVGGDGGVGGAVGPGEIDRGVGAADGGAGEVGVVEIRGGETVAGEEEARFDLLDRGTGGTPG